MTSPSLKLVDKIFSEALELSGDERAAYIESKCGGDDVLRKRIFELISAAETGEIHFDARFGGIRNRLLDEVIRKDPAASRSAEDLSGSRIGQWRLEKCLARGGLGTVYLAHRDDGEYEQRAAFKVLRRGLDTDDLVTRFRAERQILSALDHPAIAGILDGGALEDGRPYLVLEFVDGKPITEYCLENNISIRDRVRLMVEVLRALHHAHRHLIVHRDIKPSNILVSKERHVTLLDFGIAKLLDPGAVPGASTLTRTGMSMMTPGYASPEQLAGEAVTTASDTYQAGAVLFELLTGSRPRPACRKTGTIDITLPSSALRGRPEASAVRGDLDAIVRKATHADPVRRYASADEMEADLKRYLDGRPVLAQPDTLGYRLRKLHQRAPLTIPMIGTALILVAGYVYTLTSYNEQLRIEQWRASASQAFLVDILSSPDPFRPADPDAGQDITVLEALALGIDRLEQGLSGDPELRASILSSIARLYASLDQHDKAIRLGEQALAIERQAAGIPSEAVRANLEMLASEYTDINDFEKATRYSNEQLEIAQQLYHREAPALGAAEAAAGNVASAIGDFEESRRLWEQGARKMRTTSNGFSDSLIRTLIALAAQLQFDDPDAASLLIREARSRVAKLYGEDSLSMAGVRAQMASLYSAAGEYAKAEQEFLAIIPVYESKVGRDHGQTLATINNLGILYNRMDRPQDAERTYREVLDRYLLKHGEQHRTVADSYQNLATALTRAGHFEESIPMHQKAHELYRSVLPKEQPVIAYPLLSKAFAEVNIGQFSAAEATARDALDILERTSSGTYLVGVAQCLIARSLEGQGDPLADDALAEAHKLLAGSVVGETYRQFCRVADP